ncbi:MAG: TolB family protein [Methanotrichaceae archaeon]
MIWLIENKEINRLNCVLSDINIDIRKNTVRRLFQIVLVLLVFGSFLTSSGAANDIPTASSLTPNRPSPQTAGTSVTFNAGSTDPDGDQILYRFWVKGPGTGNSWQIKRDWSPVNSWTWVTSIYDVGNSDISVWVRDGNHANQNKFDSEKKIFGYTVTRENRPPVANSLTPDRPSPQTAGTSVTFNAGSTDPDGDQILYRFWVKGPSTKNAWKVMRDWTSRSTWTWSTSPSDAGEYDLCVYVRDGKHQSAGRYDDYAGYKGYQLVSARTNQPPVATGLVPGRPGPQVAGNIITWTVGAYDPDGDTIFYKLWLKGPSTGNIWKIARDWSSSNTWTWSTSPSDAGEYDLCVYVRDGKHQSAGSYDDCTGYKGYQLISISGARQLTFGETTHDRPSLIYANGGYLLAYQSWERGSYYVGDIFLKRFDSNWNQIQKVRATDETAYEDTPSVIYTGGYYYLPYVSDETGNFDIFVNKYDSNLNLVEIHQLTTSSADQDRPSLICVGNNFYLAYQSWENGPSYGGDIFITQFDSRWNPIKTVQVTSDRYYQDNPSIVYADGRFYVAYTSRETGNLDIFVKKYDSYLNPLDTGRITYDSSNQDYPSLVWQNREFALAYSSQERGSYDVYFERFDQNWNSIEKVPATNMPGDQTWPSLTYNLIDGMYWVAYVSQEQEGWNIFVQPAEFSEQTQNGYVVMDFSSSKAYHPYTLTAKFYNDQGQLIDPSSLILTRSSTGSGTTSTYLRRTSTGTYQFDSRFGSAGVNTFTVVTTIDGHHAENTMTVDVR